MEYKGEIKIGIYKITSPSGKIYIGQSTDIINRWEKDYRKINCRGQTKLYNSLIKYGWDSHEKEIIEECNLNELDKKESLYKEIYIKEYGWNKMLFCMIQDGKGGNKSSETKHKMSLSSTKNKREINVYDLKGNFIRKFNSASEAKNLLFGDTINDNTGGIISSCARDKSQKTYHGFIFQFCDDDEIKEVVDSLKDNIRLKQKKVLQFDLENNFIKEYKNSYIVEKEFKEKNIIIHSTDIRACCNGKQKTCKGFKWKYGESLLDQDIKIDHKSIDDKINKNNKIKNQLSLEKLSKYKFKNDFYRFLKSKHENIVINYNKEIDFYLPDLNIGYNLINLRKAPTYSLNYNKKLFDKYIKINTKLIQIYSDEWINKKDIVKSRILNELKLNTTKIYARKCTIHELHSSSSIKNKFLNENHIQGEDRSKIKLGLYYEGELVSLMTFNHPRLAIGKYKNSNKEDIWELLRFCNKINTNVVGASSKLLSFFIKNYNPKHIYSFADNRWSSPLSNVYITLGFTQKSISSHGYFYTKDFNKRLHRFNFNKTRLNKMGFDTENNTEKSIMEQQGYFRIWDCGTTRYELNLTDN